MPKPEKKLEISEDDLKSASQKADPAPEEKEQKEQIKQKIEKSLKK